MDRPSIPGPPPEILRVLDPPKDLAAKLRDLETHTVCGGRDEFVWDRGPYKNQAVSGYCAEPLCIDTGECTGSRWVPGVQQYTELNQESETCRPRKMAIKEVLAAVNEFARRARKRGALLDGRTEQQKLKFVGAVWRKTVDSIRGKGDWTPT